MSKYQIATGSIEDFKFNNFPISTSLVHEPESDKSSVLFSDLVLDYIKDMLMEEDMDDKYEMLQFHPDLEATEKPFYELIGQKYPPYFTSDLSQNQFISDQHLFFNTLPVSQFEKGVEEAKKFLPSADKLVINFGDLRRNKYSAITFEEPAVPPQDLDDILLCGCDFPQVVTAIREKIFNQATNMSTKHKKQNEDVVDLNTLLLHCAQTITAGNNLRANDLLRKIRHHSSPHGDAFQRLAHYIADGLEARLAGTGSEVYRSLVNKRKTVSDVLKAYQLYLATCPFRKLSYSYANKTILDTIQTAGRVHIIDFGIFFGFQWPVFIKMLSLRPGGPPKLRITGIDNPLPGFRPAERIEETGRRLAHYAARFGVPFEYRAIAAKFNEVKLEEIHFREDEMLVVNSLFRLHGLADETVVVDCPRDRVLKAIRELNPALFVNVVVNGSYGAPFFTTRFREVLYHFSAVFDMLDATVPRENEQRYLLERDMYGRFLINAISCEGLERERPENYRQWQMRCLRAGFEQIPLCREFVKMVKSKVRAYYHKDFGIDEDGEWVLQEWKGRILYCLSAWKPSFC